MVARLPIVLLHKLKSMFMGEIFFFTPQASFRTALFKKISKKNLTLILAFEGATSQNCTFFRFYSTV